jgi:hypothetical protein
MWLGDYPAGRMKPATASTGALERYFYTACMLKAGRLIMETQEIRSVILQLVEMSKYSWVLLNAHWGGMVFRIGGTCYEGPTPLVSGNPLIRGR